MAAPAGAGAARNDDEQTRAGSLQSAQVWGTVGPEPIVQALSGPVLGDPRLFPTEAVNPPLLEFLRAYA